MSEPGLGIVVVAYNTAVVVVVDNSRDAATAAACAGHGVDVDYIDPGSNLGYAAGVDLGLRRLSTELVLVLNPDMTLMRDPCEIAPDEDTIVTGVLQMSGDSWSPDQPPPNVHPLPTPGREVWRSVVSYRAYRWRRPLTAATDVPQADGAWLLARRTTWNRLGGLDRRFELYYEDVDLCRRVAVSGRLLCVPVLVGAHRGGSSAGSARALAYALLGVSRVRYYHLAGVGRFPRALGIGTSVVEFLLRSVTRRPEGDAARWRTLRLQLTEARRPGSVWLLGGPRSWDAPSPML